MKKVYKYGTGDEVPEGAVYLTTITEVMLQVVFVWHYFLVEVKDV